MNPPFLLFQIKTQCQNPDDGTGQIKGPSSSLYHEYTHTHNCNRAKKKKKKRQSGAHAIFPNAKIKIKRAKPNSCNAGIRHATGAGAGLKRTYKN